MPIFGCIQTLYTKQRTKVKHMFVYFREKHKHFSELSTMKRGSAGKNKNRRATFQRKLARREKKRRSASGSARTPFPRRGILSLRRFSLTSARKRRFYCVVCGGRFALKRGVSLSAAARSAAALVYDKLTPNCQSVVLDRNVKFRGFYKSTPKQS